MPGASIKALERVRPGNRFTLPATANNIPKPGDVIKFAFTAVESGLQTFRFKPTNQGGGLPPEQFVSVKCVTAGVHIRFGDASLAAATTGDAFLEPTDSYQDFQLESGDVCFRAIGDVAGGDLYIMFTGR